VFEHLVDPYEVGLRVVRSLRDGGVLRIGVPNGGNVRGLLRDADWLAPKGSPWSLNAVAPLEHVNCFDHEAIVAFGERLGLRLFQYPARQYLEPWGRIRFAVSALLHVVHRPRGTTLLFQKA
jgi:hypothetical protein